MAHHDLLLGLDVGTTNIKCLVLDSTGKIIVQADERTPLSYPRPGWTDFDPELIWPAVCRTIRAAVAKIELPDRIKGIAVSGVAESLFPIDKAGRSLGLGDMRLLWRYLAANTWPVIMIYMTLQLGQAILLGAALSFLGLGAQPPTAELGSMAADGRKFLTIAPHVSTLPCALIFLLVLAFNTLGDALRDALDPQLRQ